MDEYAIRVLTMLNVVKRFDGATKYEQTKIAMVPNMDKQGVQTLLREYEFQAVNPLDLFGDTSVPTIKEIEDESKKLGQFLGGGKQ